jgi:hypothetical protein
MDSPSVTNTGQILNPMLSLEYQKQKKFAKAFEKACQESLALLQTVAKASRIPKHLTDF